jgi:hypothetical protein
MLKACPLLSLRGSGNDKDSNRPQPCPDILFIPSSNGVSQLQVYVVMWHIGLLVSSTVSNEVKDLRLGTYV